MTYNSEQIGIEVAKCLKNFPDIVAALLMGSCSRGEETYFINSNGEKELLSDYEMLIIIKDKSDCSDCDKALMVLAEQLKAQSSSYCFELEWSYKKKSELRRLDKRFIFFEAKECSKIIYGNPKVLELFPRITLKNLNYCELDTIIVHRLYHVLRDTGISDEKYAKYLIARNTLDIPSVVLPLEGVLVSTYKKRIEMFLKLPESEFISEGLKKRLEDYLEMKKNYESELYDQYDLTVMGKWFLEDFRNLYTYQHNKQKGKTFVRNSRMLLSSIYRRNTDLFSVWMRWSEINEKLCADMFEAISSRKVYEQKIASIKETMMKLYGYN